MRIAVCVAYVIFIFFYFLLDFGDWWGTTYISIQALMIAYVINEQKYNHTAIERQFFDYVKYVAIADAAYTITAKAINGKDFVYHNNNVFAYIMMIGMCVILVHFAVNKDKFK